MACQAAIILSGEETKLTCICVVAKKQIFQNRFQTTMFFPMAGSAAET
jgi:hypothetical protein